MMLGQKRGIPRIDPAHDVGMHNKAHSAAEARWYGTSVIDLAPQHRLDGAQRAVQRLQERLLKGQGGGR